MLPKANRLRSDASFQRVYQYKKSLANRYLVCYQYPRADEGPTRIGFSISKRVGKAHTRNYLKRVLGEVSRLHFDHIPRGYDIIIIVRQPAAQLAYDGLEKNYLSLLKKGGLYDAPSKSGS
ncbi:ribonuclease P protein component [Peptococcus simiae]|uniref:ribonuclease P protein component n=1 Tax=Peptococcus simiae TaxID=1643805 RepID=UPI00397F94F4